jgi:hypothetical protein
MSCCNHEDFCVKAGATWHPTVRWGTSALTTVPITGITAAAPAVITAPGHGLPDGWPAAVTGVQGMTQINATRYPPAGNDWQPAHAIDANTVAFTDVSSANFTPYTSGGFLVYSTPAVLTGVEATLTIWGSPQRTGTPLATLSSTSGGITIDDTAMTITPLLQTAGLPWQEGYYTLQVTDTQSVVTELMDGVITIE